MSTTSSARNGRRWPCVAIAVAVGLIPLGLTAPDTAAASAPLAVGTADAEGVSRAVAGHRISITVCGALPMTTAKLTLKGVRGKAKGSKRTVKVAKRKTVKQLASGRYKVTAATMTHHGASAKPVPRKWLVRVTGRQGAAVQVTYARVPGAVERVSTSSRDKQANGYSVDPVWSPDGTWIAFMSFANNLAPGDTDKSSLPSPKTGDLFVKNLISGKTKLMSTGNSDLINNESSRVGFSWVSRTRLAFFTYSRADRRESGVVKDVRTGRTWTAPLPRGADAYGGWSPDGTAFTYIDHYNRTPYNLFVKTLATGAVTPVSATAGGALGNGTSDMAEWSPDGTRVAFESTATNLSSRNTRGHTNVYAKTVATGALELVSADVHGSPGGYDSHGPVWSPDGTRIAFVSNLAPGQSLSSGDLVVKSLATGFLRRISRDAWSPLWSPDGSTILFVRGSTGSLMISDPATGSVSRLLRHSNGNGTQWSPDGTQVLLSSSEALVPGDTNGNGNRADGLDVFVVSVGLGRITRVSTTSDGAQAQASHRDPEVDDEGGSWSGVWSPDGTRVAFRYWSYPSENLVPNDTNRSPDVFVKTLK